MLMMMYDKNFLYLNLLYYIHNYNINFPSWQLSLFIVLLNELITTYICVCDICECFHSRTEQR